MENKRVGYKKNYSTFSNRDMPLIKSTERRGGTLILWSLIDSQKYYLFSCQIWSEEIIVNFTLLKES